MVLKSNLSKIAQRAPQLAGEALMETAEVVYDISQQLVAVDKGLLKASSGTDITTFANDGSPSTVIVGYGREGSQREDVAIWIEFGTSNMSSQPYLIPSFSQAEPTFEKILTKKAEGLPNA